MPEIVELRCRAILVGQKSLLDTAGEILEFATGVAIGVNTKAELRDDFILWKRGISL
jgi:hypothetical protein